MKLSPPTCTTPGSLSAACCSPRSWSHVVVMVISTRESWVDDALPFAAVSSRNAVGSRKVALLGSAGKLVLTRARCCRLSTAPAWM